MGVTGVSLTGSPPVKVKLLEGVTTVSAGAVKIISKQQEGYRYIKP